MRKEVVQFVIFFVALVILIAALQIQVLDKPTVQNDQNYIKTVGAAGGGAGPIGGGGSGGTGSGSPPDTNPEDVEAQIDDGGTSSGGGGSSTVCGDGVYQKFVEQCDDGNKKGGDGCSATCDLESGWTCKSPSGGTKSYCSFCGDGLIQLTGDTSSSYEACDDQNSINNDGCSSSCNVEPGYSCTGSPSNCGATQAASSCGNGLLDGDETCDDGFFPVSDGDGCSAICEIELGWICLGEPSECILDENGEGSGAGAMCGNSMVELEEQCDDGNSDSEDGCSASCEIEPLWTCEPEDANYPDGKSICSCVNCVPQRGGVIDLEQEIDDIAESISALFTGENSKPVSIFEVNSGRPLPEGTNYISLAIKENDQITFKTRENVDVTIIAKKLSQDSLGLTLTRPGRTEIFSLTSSTQTKFLDLNGNEITDFAIFLLSITAPTTDLEAEIRLVSLEESSGNPSPESTPESSAFIEEIIQNSPELSTSKQQLSVQTETQRIALVLSIIGLIVVLVYIIVRRLKHPSRANKPSKRSLRRKRR